VTRLEAELGTRLFQRTTREVALTEPGRALKERYTDIFSKVDDAVDYVGSLTAGPRGLLRISAGIGFGLNVLSELLPAFLERHPGINVSLELTSRLVDLVAEDVNVAIRIGAMPDLELVAKRLGTMRRYLCAAPAYLQRRGTPQTFDELHDHDLLEMPGVAGRSRSWTFAREGEHDVSVDVHTRVSVNDALTIHRLAQMAPGWGACRATCVRRISYPGASYGCFPNGRCPPSMSTRCFRATANCLPRSEHSLTS
jgi:LysR family transcriptional regulator, regulator for bpeEF and oprC